MPIGPQLPAHLLPSAGPSLPSPESSSLHSPPGDDEDSDDDYGPSLPPDLVETRTTGPVAGPSLPPALAGPSKPSLGPQLPPHLASSSSSSSSRAGPSLGPTLPPASYRPRYEEEDSDDGFGPMPLPAGVQAEENEGARMFREREERMAEKERKEREGAGKPKREEWMLVPPKEMDLMSSIDTTKLKSRGFATGKAAISAAKKEGVSNLWTETPAERQQRLKDEMMGKKRKAEGPAVEEETDDERRKRVRDQQLKDEVDRHNAATRGDSLVDAHTKQAKKNKKDGDEPAPTAIWDRERDMSLGGRLMDDSKRANTIKNAKGLGGRFAPSGFM